MRPNHLAKLAAILVQQNTAAYVLCLSNTGHGERMRAREAFSAIQCQYERFARDCTREEIAEAREAADECIARLDIRSLFPEPTAKAA